MRAVLSLPSTRRLLTLTLVFFLMMACASPTPVNQQSSSPSPLVIDRGLASISFDDGTIGHYTHAWPELQARNLPATYYLVSDALGWGKTTINPEQARQLVEDGQEIGNHTRDHQDLAKLTPSQVRAQFAEAQDAIESQVGVRPTTCAYPYGSSNGAVLAEAEKQFKGCRSTQGGLNDGDRLLTYDLLSYYIQRGTTAAEVREAAEKARTSNTWVIFVYHGVDSELTGPEDLTPTRFADHMDAILSTGIPVLTVDAALAAMSS